MPCLLVLAGFFVPRVVLALLWVLTDWWSRAFDGWLWPVLGFLFMPYTTLAYLIGRVHGDGQISGGYLVLLIIAVFLDLGMHGASGKKAQRKQK